MGLAELSTKIHQYFKKQTPNDAEENKYGTVNISFVPQSEVKNQGFDQNKA